jgi:flagellar protein FlbD
MRTRMVPSVITLTRLSGSVFALNSDLIERVDSTPDTVITLVDGTKYVVREPLTDVVDAIREYRGAVIAESARMGAGSDGASANPPARRLVAVPDDPDQLPASPVAPVTHSAGSPREEGDR